MSLLLQSCPQTLSLLSFAKNQGYYAENLRQTNNLNVERKPDGSRVTLADKTISDEAMKALPAILNVPVVSEENPSENKDYERFWLIDPIDGTSSYIGMHPGYAIAIALIEEGRPVLSVVVAPAFNVSYFAKMGYGAFKMGHDGRTSQLGSVRINHSRFASFYNRSPVHEQQLAAFIQANGIDAYNVHPESSLLKYCYAAEGTYAIAGGWSDLESWDIAAADLIVQESGGKMISAHTQQPFYYSSKDSYVSSPIAIANGVNVRLL